MHVLIKLNICFGALKHYSFTVINIYPGLAYLPCPSSYYFIAFTLVLYPSGNVFKLLGELCWIMSFKLLELFSSSSVSFCCVIKSVNLSVL
jgi:hypothetical protein